jgi:branched-chain amino acid transport system permease protein
MDNFLNSLPQTLVNGLTLGAVYALIALGYSMVYGVLKLLNFAHGDIYMVGAYVSYGIYSMWRLDDSALIPAAIILVVMLAAGMAGAGLVSVSVERFAYRPLRNAPRIAPLISALGVSFILQNLVQVTVSAQPLSFGSGTIIPSDMAVSLGGVSIHISRILIVVVTVVLLIGLAYLVNQTRLGRAIRAVSMDLDAAEMMGVNVNRVIVMTFLIGGVLAGAGGVLVGVTFFSIRHTMGYLAGLKGFTAAVLGGIGNLPGAALGGLLLGLTESFASVYISVTFKDAIAFLLLVIVLLVRPSGILGTPVIHKV